MRVIFHIDLNAFFANAEIIDNPSLKNKPLVIAHNSKRSVCSTASYEARKYGIHSAMPLALAKKKCKQLIIVEPNYNLYQKLSHEFFEILRSYSLYLEIASIDEGYLDVSEYIETYNIHPVDLALEIQQKVLNTLKLPCSIGISPNKFLSKMASDMKKPLGIMMLTKSNIKEKLWPLKVGDMFGIGKQTAPKLEDLGIKTIGDVASYDNYQNLRLILGKNALLYYYRANGKDDSKVIYEESDRKSISNSHTFYDDIDDEKLIKDKFKELTLNVVRRLERSKMLTRQVGITLRYNDFTTITRQMNLTHYVNNYDDIYSYVTLLFYNHYNHKPLRLIGVTVLNIVRRENAYQQLSFFDKVDDTLYAKDIIDKLNKDENIKLMKASDLIAKK